LSVPNASTRRSPLLGDAVYVLTRAYMVSPHLSRAICPQAQDAATAPLPASVAPPIPKRGTTIAGMSDRAAGLRLAELLAPLSLVMDLRRGQPAEESIQSCLLATGLFRIMELPEEDVAVVFYASLLRHLGCTASSHEESLVLGDELAMRPVMNRMGAAARHRYRRDREVGYDPPHRRVHAERMWIRPCCC
jgi:hypothetical protein